MNIPFVDLKAQYIAIKPNVDEAIKNVINECAFIKGKPVADFEKAFALKNEAKHCIGVANGTDAIYIVLKMLGVGKGDEVITVANSWISTSETITQCGAKPVFVDIEEGFYTINPDKIVEKITSNTKAIIPVHLYGQTVEISKVVKICKDYKLHLIEDCAQAHFAEFEKQKVGTFGIAATYSFYPGKNLGAYGDAGAIITNNDELAAQCRMYASHGSLQKHKHLMEGINSRLDGLQAAILLAKLPFVNCWNELRNRNASLYTQLLFETKQVQTPSIRQNTKHIFHVYSVLAENRDELKLFLKKKGIETAIHYPTALPFLPAYKYLNHNTTEFPVAFKNQHKLLSLPMFPELNELQIQYVVDMINKFYDKKK